MAWHFTMSPLTLLRAGGVLFPMTAYRYGLLAAGRNVAQCFAEEFIFGAHGLSLRVIVKNIIPVGLEQVGFGGGWLCPGGQNVAARQLALTTHRRYRG